MKVSIEQNDIKVINIYKPNDRSSKYMKQKLTELKGEIDNSTIIVGNFRTVVTIMDSSVKQK